MLSEEILMGRVKEAIDGKCFLGNLININCNYETCMKHLIFSINLQGPGDIKKKKRKPLHLYSSKVLPVWLI